MSSNKMATKSDLQSFYNRIFPYLGGSADAGFTPIGSIIAIMGVTAPTNYLACNGQIVNVADYPELANYFEQQFGTKYKFGGSGTTFGIPNLKGEFLRGTGTNGHSGQGNGESVGVHQDSTKIPVYALDGTTFAVFDNGTYNYPKHPDSVLDRTNTRKNFTSSGSTTVSNIESTVTVRPTNTSILWCIATKDIYLNPSLDYSTSEKVVGKWTDGKTLYQRTFTIAKAKLKATTQGTVSHNAIAHGISGISKVVSVNAFFGLSTDASACITFPFMGDGSNSHIIIWADKTNITCDTSVDPTSWCTDATVTIQYTKTT